MKAFTALLDIVPGWIWAICCAGLFGWGGINAYRVNSAHADLAELKAAHAQALIVAQQQADKKSAELKRTKDEAIAQAEKRAATNAAAAGRARSELDRLREQSASGIDRAGTSQAACTEYATAATAVLNECGSALAGLAEKADGHVNDIRTITGAWPAWDKFTGEMTDFKARLLAFTKGQP